MMRRPVIPLFGLIPLLASCGFSGFDFGDSKPVLALVTSDQMAVYLVSQDAPAWDRGFPATIRCMSTRQSPLLISKVEVKPAATVVDGLPIRPEDLYQELVGVLPPVDSAVSENPCAFVWIEIDNQATFGDFHSAYVAAIQAAESSGINPNRILVGTPKGGGRDVDLSFFFQ